MPAEENSALSKNPFAIALANQDAAVLKRKQAAIRQLDRWVEKQRQKAKTAAA